MDLSAQNVVARGVFSHISSNTAHWYEYEVPESEPSRGYCALGPGCMLESLHLGPCVFPPSQGGRTRSQRLCVPVDAKDEEEENVVVLEGVPVVDEPRRRLEVAVQDSTISPSPEPPTVRLSSQKRPFTELAAEEEGIEAFLHRAHLAQYLPDFLESGWDDLKFMRELHWANGAEFAAATSISLKPGHLAKFMAYYCREL